jgi:hypothetical protein
MAYMHVGALRAAHHLALVACVHNFFILVQMAVRFLYFKVVLATVFFKSIWLNVLLFRFGYPDVLLAI